MIFEYDPKGVCSRHFIFDIEDNKINSLQIIGGCAGNTQGITKLVEGMDVDDVIKKLKDIDCHGRGTSCPDQISEALVEFKSSK